VVTSVWTNERINAQTTGQPENIMLSPTVGWQMHKKHSVKITLTCFYIAGLMRQRASSHTTPALQRPMACLLKTRLICSNCVKSGQLHKQLEEASTHKSADTCQHCFCDSCPRPLTLSL